MIWILACVNQETVKPTELVEASQNVIFAATETLGPHRFQVISIRQEYRSDQLELESTEVLDIEWHSWDSFSFSNNVDGESTLEVVVTSGSCWKRMYGGEWQRRPDAEPYRVQLRQKWNVWDRVTQPFLSGLSFVSQGEEKIEGRNSHHYQLAFSEISQNQSGLTPEEIQGEIWVDTETAVRLLGDIEARLTSESYTKVISLKLSRTDINQLEGIVAPDAPQLSPELLQILQPKEPLPEKPLRQRIIE